MDSDLEFVAEMGPLLAAGIAPTGPSDPREDVGRAVRRLRDSAREPAAISERAFRDQAGLNPDTFGLDVAGRQRLIRNDVRNTQALAEIDGFIEDGARTCPSFGYGAGTTPGGIVG